MHQKRMFKLTDLNNLESLAENASAEKVRQAASELLFRFGIVIHGLNCAGWDPEDEDNLKHPHGRAMIMPRIGDLEQAVEKMVSALQEDDHLAHTAIASIEAFYQCRRSKDFHLEYCVASLLANLSENMDISSATQNNEHVDKN